MKTGVSYFGNRFLKHFLRDLEDIKAHHCTYIVHCFEENDLLYYLDTMKEIVAATHEAGLEAWIDPWGVGGVFGGEAQSGLLGRHPEALQVTSDGQHVPAACLNNPQFRQFMHEWIDGAAYIGGDVVFWDEPHLYIPWEQLLAGQLDVPWSCRCSVCQEKFAAEYGHPMPTELTEEVQAFRLKTCLDFLHDVSDYAKKKGLRNALCLLPVEIPQLGLPSFEEASRLETIDIFGTDPYWVLFSSLAPQLVPPLEEFVGGYTRRVVELCRRTGKEDNIWVQAFLVPEGLEETAITECIRIAVANGATNIAAWGYAGCGHMSSRACARPELVWEIIGREFGKLLCAK